MIKAEDVTVELRKSGLLDDDLGDVSTTDLLAKQSNNVWIADLEQRRRRRSHAPDPVPVHLG